MAAAHVAHVEKRHLQHYRPYQRLHGPRLRGEKLTRHRRRAYGAPRAASASAVAKTSARRAGGGPSAGAERHPARSRRQRRHGSRLPVESRGYHLKDMAHRGEHHTAHHSLAGGIAAPLGAPNSRSAHTCLRCLVRQPHWVLRPAAACRGLPGPAGACRGLTGPDGA